MAYFNVEDLEEIKKLKARYFRFLDTKQWQEYGNIFTHDVQLRWGPGPDGIWRGRAEVIREASRVLEHIQTVHHGHMPEIDFIDVDHARGIWAMVDFVQSATNTMTGYGHYHEEYLRDTDGQWRIKKMTLTRLRIDMVVKKQDILRAVE